MNRWKSVAFHMAVFCGLLALLWLCLLLTAMIPNGALQENMEASALSYREKAAFSFENGAKWNGISDNYADAVLLNVSWYMGSGNPFSASLDTWYYDGESLGVNAGLYLAVMGEAVQPDVDYSRYWHGSAIFVRLLHLVTDVSGMKLTGLAAAAALSLLTVGILVKNRHYDLAAALLLAMASVQIWNIRLSLEYQPAFLLCFLFCPLYLWAERRKAPALTYLSVAGGVSTAFFDFLTTETIVILMPLILVTAVRAAEGRLESRKEHMRQMVLCGISWLCAYAGTFLTKWILASVITGENKFVTALSAVEERFGGSLPVEEIKNPLLRIPLAVAANMTVWFGGQERVDIPRVMTGLLLTFLLLGSVLYLFYKKENKKDGGKMLLLLGSMVLLRYMVLSNHSYLHEFFTYRALICPVMAVLAGMALSMRRRENSVFKQDEKSRKCKGLKE